MDSTVAVCGRIAGRSLRMLLSIDKGMIVDRVSLLLVVDSTKYLPLKCCVIVSVPC